MVASVAGEMSVVPVDHGQAGAHVAGEVEGGDAGTEREGREGMAEIVDAPKRTDPGGELGGLPVTGAEVVQVEVAAAQRREQKLRLARRTGSCSSASSATAWSGTARTLPSVFVHLTRPFLNARRT